MEWHTIEAKQKGSNATQSKKDVYRNIF